AWVRCCRRRSARGLLPAEQLRIWNLEVRIRDHGCHNAGQRHSGTTNSKFEIPNSELTIFTIGHSTRTLDDFLALLRAHAVTRLADVRTVPKSRRHPHFAGDALSRSLPDAGVAYRHFPGLGGLRKPRPDSRNTAWRHASFRGYADHMQTD